MKKIYDNKKFEIYADTQCGNYRVINTTSDICEYVTQTEYEALHYAVRTTNQLAEALKPENTSWPRIN